MIAEVPAGSEASKAYDAGAHTALLMHLSPANRPDLRERLRRAMADGNERQQQRAKSLRSRFGTRVKHVSGEEHALAIPAMDEKSERLREHEPGDE